MNAFWLVRKILQRIAAPAQSHSNFLDDQGPDAVIFLRHRAS
jgi:hypothetical protein